MIQLQQLTKTYQDKTALGGIDLTIPEGRITVLCGPSGSGKTTLLRILAGLEQPDAGTITGIPDHLGMTFQDDRLLPESTVEQNILYGLDVRSASRQDRLQRAQEAAQLCGCPPLDQKAGTLSGGQKQRVALARALAARPKLLLLDESLSALDAPSRQDLQIRLLNLQQQLGMTMVFVTHDPEEAQVMGDQVVILEQGRIRWAGTREHLLDCDSPEAISFFRPHLIQAAGCVFDRHQLTWEEQETALPVQEALCLRQGPERSLWHLVIGDVSVLADMKNGGTPGPSVYVSSVKDSY